MDVTLVTGARGLLGKAIMQSHIGEITSTKLIGLSRKPSNDENIIECKYDQNFIQSIQSKGWNVKHIIAAAGFPPVYMSFKQPWNDNTNNFAPILFTLEMARAFGASIIYTSSVELYGSDHNALRQENSLLAPRNFYGLNKYFSERYVQFYADIFGVKYLILRPSIFIGENISKNIIFELKKAIHKTKTVDIYCTSDSVLNFIHVDDVSNAIEFLLQQNKWNEIFNIGSDEDLKISELIDWVEKTNKVKLNIHQCDTEFQFKTAPSGKINKLGWKPVKTIRERLDYYFKQPQEFS